MGPLSLSYPCLVVVEPFVSKDFAWSLWVECNYVHGNCLIYTTSLLIKRGYTRRFYVCFSMLHLYWFSSWPSWLLSSSGLSGMTRLVQDLCCFSLEDQWSFEKERYVNDRKIENRHKFNLPLWGFQVCVHRNASQTSMATLLCFQIQTWMKTELLSQLHNNYKNNDLTSHEISSAWNYMFMSVSCILIR